MKASIMSTPVLAIALAGCGDRAETPADGVAGGSRTVAEQGAAASLQRGTGAGTVTAIDAGKGSVTLDHGAIAGLNWPAMQMGFEAKPEQLAGLQVGDKVDFEVEWNGKTGSLTSIREAQ